MCVHRHLYIIFLKNSSAWQITITITNCTSAIGYNLWRTPNRCSLQLFMNIPDCMSCRPYGSSAHAGSWCLSSLQFMTISTSLFYDSSIEENANLCLCWTRDWVLIYVIFFFGQLCRNNGTQFARTVLQLRWPYYVKR